MPTDKEANVFLSSARSGMFIDFARKPELSSAGSDIIRASKQTMLPRMGLEKFIRLISIYMPRLTPLEAKKGVLRLSRLANHRLSFFSVPAFLLEYL